ncbi:unnamed protein product [marine sediment metagenome]|uniref:Uncharacterized protein n=1 Tax=marine sediment metagenome TaxID=412755 RepID=X1BYS4_9ZZZZ
MLTKAEVLSLSRREVRYHLYRIRTYEEGGSSHKANALKEYYERQKGFTNWSGFARTWDVGDEGHHKIVEREFTEEQEWNSELSSLIGD